MPWRQVLVLFCTIFTVQPSPCSWVEVLTPWNKGFKAVVEIQMETTVDHWEIGIQFSENINKFEAWQGRVTKFSNTSYIVSNNCYNNMVYACQCFRFHYIVRHDPLWKGNMTFTFNGELVPACYSSPCKSIAKFERKFIENGLQYTQENTYNPSTGVLTLKVPPHGNFSQSTFILDPDMAVLSTNGSCFLSALSENLNVSNMAEEMEANQNEVQYTPTYKIKIRKSLLAQSELYNLSTESNNVCKDKILRKTVDKTVTKTEFEMLLKMDENGESGVVITNSTARSIYLNRKPSCWIEDACTNPGPNACGYGFPNPAGGGFSAHQLSATTICVQCCMEPGPVVPVGPGPVVPGPVPVPVQPDRYKRSSSGCCMQDYPEACMCKDISNKVNLMDCILGNETHSQIYEDQSGIVVSQNMTFNAFNPEGNARALKFHVPAHAKFQDLTVIIHAANDGYWHKSSLRNNLLMKIGNICHILDLPSDFFPMDMAVNFLEQRGEAIKTEDRTIRYTTLTDVVELLDIGQLHPDIQDACRNLKTFKSERVLRVGPINTDLAAGTSYDTGCIRWPIPAGGTIVVHDIVSADHSVSNSCNFWDVLECTDVVLLAVDRCLDDKACILTDPAVVAAGCRDCVSSVCAIISC